MLVSGDFRQLFSVIEKSNCGMIANYIFKKTFFGML